MERIVMNEPPRLRRRPRVRLRTRVWLVAIVIAAGALAWLSDQPRRRERAIDAAQQRRRGGYKRDPRRRPRPHEGAFLRSPRTRSNRRSPASRRWLAERLGPGFGHEVTLVNLDAKPVTDADLASLSGLGGLRFLYLERHAHHRRKSQEPQGV